MSTLSRLVLLSIMAIFLGACTGSDTNKPGQPSASDEFALTIIARTDSGAPDDYGVVPGDPAVGAKVSVEAVNLQNAEATGGLTDESGRLVVMVKSGKYRISVKLETHDPYCHWFSGADAEVKDENKRISIDDLWVLCE